MVEGRRGGDAKAASSETGGGEEGAGFWLLEMVWLVWRWVEEEEEEEEAGVDSVRGTICSWKVREWHPNRSKGGWSNCMEKMGGWVGGWMDGMEGRTIAQPFKRRVEQLCFCGEGESGWVCEWMGR